VDHIGIDLGGRESQLCIRRHDGEIVEELRVPTAGLGDLLRERRLSRVVMETCAEAFAIATAAKHHGHQVRVVPSTLVRSLGVGARRIKTDVRDARLLSEASCRMELPAVHVASMAARELKAFLTARDSLVSSRTLVVNSVRGILRTQLVRPRSGGIDSFPRRVREKLLQLPCGVPDYIERQLLAIEAVNGQVKEADKELGRIVDADPTCRLLMTAPGVGPVTAARFKSAIDEVGRFPDAHSLESYLGLVPGEASSSDSKHRTGLTKAGANAVRGSLSQASWVAWRLYPNDPMVQWANNVALRRGTYVAICALSRKLAGVLYAMWRDGKGYDSSRLSHAGARPA
jgi:transposase